MSLPNANDNSFPLIEDVIAGKQGLGAEYKFEKNTFEIKPNQYGANGVFTRCSLPEGTEVISLPKLNGSLTPLRAYEESQELLKKLGPQRFNLAEKFILACAMYVRYTNTDTKDSDILITEPDFKAAYYGSPMTAYRSFELTELLGNNSRRFLEEATNMNKLIDKLDVDLELFRAMLGYTSSRNWAEVGLIPVLDRFNSSYLDDANCEFFMKDGRLGFKLSRDVEVGEELTWMYNNADAITTWLGYGYRDDKRPTIAFVEIILNEEEKNRLEAFTIEKLGWKKKDMNPSDKINQHKFSQEITYVGKLADPALIRNAIIQSLGQFSALRQWFRVFILSSKENDVGTIAANHLDGDEFFFGLEFEKEVLASIRSALQNGLLQVHKRVEKFTSSEVGRPIDMADYIDMIESASKAWDTALAVVESICSVESNEECIKIINSKLNLDLQSKDEVKPALSQINLENPTLLASLIAKYVQYRL